MTQSYPQILSTSEVRASRALLLQRDEALKSDFSGTVFPTTDLVVGMSCFREDLLQRYTLVNTSPVSWVLDADFNETYQSQEDADARYPQPSVNTTWTGTFTFNLGISTNGNDVYLADGALVSADAAGAFADRTGGDIDHIWHDPVGNFWHFVSGATYKSTGNSGVVAGSLTLSDYLAIPSRTTAQRPTGNLPYFQFNSDLGQYEAKNPSTGEWGGIARSGGSSGFDEFKGTLLAGQDSITLPKVPATGDLILGFLGRLPFFDADYTITSQTLTLNSPVIEDTYFHGWVFTPGEIGDVPAGSVGADQISNAQVNAIKLKLGITDRALGEVFWLKGPSDFSTVPSYAKAFNGDTMDRTIHSHWWAIVQQLDNYNPDQATKEWWQWGPGNGSTNFTMPDLMGHPEGARIFFAAVQSGQPIGEFVQDAMQQITGSVETRGEATYASPPAVDDGALSVTAAGGTTSAGKVSPGTTSTFDLVEFDSANSPGARTADHTRPKSIGLIPCIVVTQGVTDPALINAGAVVAKVDDNAANISALFEFQRASQNVVHNTTNAQQTYTAPVWTDASGVEVDVLTTTINNVRAGNKVEISLTIFYESNAVGCPSFYFTRNGTDLIRGTGAGGNGANTFFTADYSQLDNDSTPNTITVTFIDDSPDAGTNVYRLMAQSPNGSTYTLYVNRTVNPSTAASFERGVSSMVLREIPNYSDAAALAAARAVAPSVLETVQADLESVKPTDLISVSGDWTVDLRPYLVNGRLDVTINLYEIYHGISADAAFYAQFSSDAGVSYISSNYYDASIYTTTGTTTVNSENGNGNRSNMRVGYNSGGLPSGRGMTGFLRIMTSVDASSDTVLIGNVQSIAAGGNMMVWLPQHFLPAVQANWVRFTWTNSTTTSSGKISIINNLRAN